jgi:ABC-type branched-subunit amino acid transport system substrate-binding protein
MRNFLKTGMVCLVAAAFTQPGFAQKIYGPGVTDTEIKIGQTMPFSGPASSFGLVGKTEANYFKMVNEKGGINGRKINLIALDDALSPPKGVEQTRKLVEGEEVLAIYGSIGTAINMATAKYLDSEISQ